MKLLIDAGNTRIKWAVVEGPGVNGSGADGSGADGSNWRHSGTLPVAQAGELPQHLAGLQQIRQAWVSNVAGKKVAQHIRNACAPAQPRFIVAQAAQCGVHNGYSSPAQLGSDRWAALIAAWRQVLGACLVVNSGTATTVDALSARGEFIGGLILPGMELMRRNLCDATAQLQAAQGQYAPFPLNTADALYSGAVQASCGAIERQHALLGQSSAPVVLSGGAAATLRDHLNAPLRIVDNLVLRGLWLIAREADAQ